MDNDVHRSYPPPAPEDRVDGDLDDAADDGDLDGARGSEPGGDRDRAHDAGPAGTSSRGGGARHRLAPPTPDQRVELTHHSYLPWVVLVTLLGMAVAVYFFL
ncbi:hypothetical protein [Georgenia daeguensis]|uniref:Uncharacterized protein n=1 Tax=Georgenia daeguensis TaxID=908355 RepID=A0ABP8ER14_9MICO